MIRGNFSPARNVRSMTAPDSNAFSRVRTNAPPLPGFTCWNSTIRKTVPSTSMCMPFLNWLVETISAMCASAYRGGRRSRGGEPFDGVAVALGPLALDAVGDDVGDHRVAAELLAVLDVRQVHLDHLQALLHDELDRVADRVRVVRPGTRVHHQAVHRPADRLVQVLDERALVVGLEAACRGAVVARPLVDLRFQVRQRQGPVQRRLAAAEQVQVDAVQDRDHSADATARASASSPGSMPCTGAPTAS